MYKIITMVLVIALGITYQTNAPDSIKPKQVKGLIVWYANQYGVDANLMDKTIKCESGYNANAINNTPREYSVGLSQINLKAHKDITVSQAKDEDFAISFMAKNIAKGKGNMWTCYSKIKK